MYLRPSDIYFSQDTINPYFHINTNHGGRLIGETLDDLCEGRCTIYDIPRLRVANHEDRWVAIDNRRLWIFRQMERLGKCDEIPVKEEPTIFPFKLTSQNDGTSIDVRGFAGGEWFSKESVKDTEIPRPTEPQAETDDYSSVDTVPQLEQLHIGQPWARPSEETKHPSGDYKRERNSSKHGNRTDVNGKGKLLVAAIDFGTTNSGYAFSFWSYFLNDPLKIITNQWETKTGSTVSFKAPTCMLFNPNQQFDSFGFDAEEKYALLASNGMHTDWYFFKNFKMLLYENKNLNRTTLLEDDKGLKFPAKLVFTECIKYLRNHLLHTSLQNDSTIRDNEIHWVLTVPAIWNENAKQFMREAAIGAGIPDSCLSLALEPEAASIFCHYAPLSAGEDEGATSDGISLDPGTKYLMLDAGGGTIDVTVHEILPNYKVKEIYKANGGPFGGTKIDEEFLTLLADIFGQETIDEFKNTYKKDYLDLLRDFEIKKARINPDLDNKFTFKIPASITMVYKALTGHKFSNTSAKLDLQDKISYYRDKLRVDSNVVKDLFKHTSVKIVMQLLNILRKPEIGEVDTIVMVGGFSESKMLQDTIRKYCSDKVVVTPAEAGLAVVKGAVIFGHRPDVIVSRICRYTYGVDICKPFDFVVHPKNKLVAVRGVLKCRDCFGKHVTIDERIEVGKALSERTYMMGPASGITPVVSILRIFSSVKKNPAYIDESGCSCIGEVVVDVVDVACHNDRRIKIRLMFGETELGVQAKFVETGQEVKARFNFLG